MKNKQLLGLTLFLSSVILLTSGSVFARTRNECGGNKVSKNCSSHIARDIVKDVKLNVQRGHGRISSEMIRDMHRDNRNKHDKDRDYCKKHREWKKPKKETKDTYDVSVLFLFTNGSCIADASGLTYVIDGVSYPDTTFIYAEAYWGEYPLYLPGQTASISVDVAYAGKAAEVALKLVTETHAMNTDGSNGGLVNTQTKDFTAANNAASTVDASFTLPMQPKGLYRVIAKIYSGTTLLMTKEALFCPPAEEDIE